MITAMVVIRPLEGTNYFHFLALVTRKMDGEWKTEYLDTRSHLSTLMYAGYFADLTRKKLYLT